MSITAFHSLAIIPVTYSYYSIDYFLSLIKSQLTNLSFPEPSSPTATIIHYNYFGVVDIEEVSSYPYPLSNTIGLNT